MLIGVAMKKTWNCGIIRPSAPIADGYCEAEHKERRGKLEAEREGAADEAHGQFRHVARRERSSRRKQLVAPEDRGDGEVMEVRRKDHGNAQHGEEGADDGGLRALRGIQGLREGEARLGGDEIARDLERSS